ncbi:ATP-binding cassette domain-containing protein, partial [Lacrimispora sp. 38-1]|uniref:ATP-binding cassette domain-containing protein n=1 Tax=Lacrimispora sp. 38-1 TaxID=3125778 RepID=UPI003CF2AE57
LTAIFLLRQSLPLAMLTLIPIMIFVLTMYLSHETMQKNSINLFEKDEEFNTTLIQSIKNIETLKNFKVTKKFEEINNKKLNNLLIMSEKFVIFDSIQSNVKNLIISLFTLYIFALGAYLVINDNMANGMLLVFNSLSIKMFSPFQKIASLQALFEQGKIAQKKYEDIVNTLMPRKEGNMKVSLIEKISLCNVKFVYGIETLIFDNLNLTLLRNSNTAILGKSGSGKTTLAKLLANYFDTQSGNIKINDKKYQEYYSQSISDHILYVPQYVEIFNDTILNNITLGRDIPLTEVEERAKNIGFNEIINLLPNGYLTIIGENGLKLSMGQMQMLNILRATIIEYSVIIFDEVTNGLDLHLKKSVANYLLEYGNIKIFLTHDIEFASLCDDIYIINNHHINRIDNEYKRNPEIILKLI